MSNQFTHIVIGLLQYVTDDDDKMFAYYDEAIRQEKIARAAPELLEALKSVKTLIPAMLNFAWITEAQADAMRNAINKAEGKE